MWAICYIIQIQPFRRSTMILAAFLVRILISALRPKMNWNWYALRRMSAILLRYQLRSKWFCQRSVACCLSVRNTMIRSNICFIANHFNLFNFSSCRGPGILYSLSHPYSELLPVLCQLKGWFNSHSRHFWTFQARITSHSYLYAETSNLSRHIQSRT